MQGIDPTQRKSNHIYIAQERRYNLEIMRRECFLFLKDSPMPTPALLRTT